MKKILVPIDGSENSLGSLKLLASFDMLNNNKIYLLNVRSLNVVYGGYFAVSHEDNMLDYLQKTGEENLKAAEKLLEGKNYEAVVKLGIDFREIIDFAEEVGADLIVMGSHGRTGLNKVIMGSVSSKVLAYSKTPVMITRPHQEKIPLD